MTVPPHPEAPLADLYRQARALATAEGAHPEEAQALAEAVEALFASETGALRGRAAPAERQRDRVRRAVISALRHQAMMTRRAWMARGGPGVDGHADASSLLQRATVLAEGALRLHREGEVGRGETEYVLRFLRATAAIASAPPRQPHPAAARTPVAPPVAAPVPEASAAEVASVATEPAPPPPALPSAGGGEAPHPPADIFVIGLPPEAEPETPTQRTPRLRLPRPRPQPAPSPQREADAGEPRRRGTLVAVLAVIGVIGFAAGVLTAPRLLGRSGRTVKVEQPAVIAPPAVAPPVGSPVPSAPPIPAATPRVASAPAAGPVTSAPSRPTTRPTARPSPRETPRVTFKLAPGQVALILRSDPSGAQVYVGGVLQGTTPLRVPVRPGSVVAVVLRRGSRTWRGIVQVGPAREQVINVTLPPPPPAVAQAPRNLSPSPAPPVPAAAAIPAPSPSVNPRAHHDALVQQGVQLYQAGWYGPAIARFKQAIAVMPTPRAYLWLGRAAFKAGRHEEARRALERVLALAPGTAAAREAQALLNRLRLAERGT